MTPVEALLRSVEWHSTGGAPGDADNPDGLPYATHSGVLDIMGVSLRCYRLNTGETIVDGDDLQKLFEGDA